MVTYIQQTKQISAYEYLSSNNATSVSLWYQPTFEKNPSLTIFKLVVSYILHLVLFTVHCSDKPSGFISAVW